MKAISQQGAKIFRVGRLGGLIAALGLAVAVHAAPVQVTTATDGKIALSVATERVDAQYHRGETVTFMVQLVKGEDAVEGVPVHWEITKDGLPLQQEGKTELHKGGVLLKGHLNEPGFLKCFVDCVLPSGKKLEVSAAAAIDPLEIAPSLPTPKDFDAFWTEQKKKLAAVPMNIRIKPVPSPSARVECFEVQADCLGKPMMAYLSRPVGAKPKSHPAIFLPHGAGVRSSLLGRTIEWAEDGYLAMDFNAHGLPNGQPEAYYTELSNGEYKDYTHRGRESRETMYLGNIILRMLRAIDVLAAQPEWDGRHLIAFGRSMGGGQSIAAGALDPRVSFVSAELPTFSDHTGIVIGRVDGWPKLINDGTAQPDPRVIEAARYFDSCNFAPRIHVPVSMTVGFIDGVCPPTGVFAAYNQITSPKHIWTHVDTGHTGRRDYNERMRQEVLAYVRADTTGNGAGTQE